MKSLIVYYSYEGNSEFISKEINKRIKSDIVAIEPLKEKVSKSLFRFVWGAKEVYMTKKPDIKDIDIDFSKYDIIFIGTPCWFGTFAPPLNTFFNKYKIENKRIAIYVCNGGNLRHTEKDLRDTLSNNDILSIKSFIYPLKNIDKAKEEVNTWLDSLKKEY